MGIAPFRQPGGKIFFSKEFDNTLYAWDWKKGMEWRKITHPDVKMLKLSDAMLKDFNTYLATDNPMPTYLDVLVEDDTFVDYMTLRVWYY